jgi:putative membrane-bound dehydrogenase-like protein
MCSGGSAIGRYRISPVRPTRETIAAEHFAEYIRFKLLLHAWRLNMRLLAAAGLLVIVAAYPSVAEKPVPKTQEVKLNGHTFNLPVGFEIEQVAGPPLVNRPISADFDEQGRLYVSDSSGSNDKVEEQLKQRPHRIMRLEDTHGDGKFNKSTVFADKMMFPEGTMWYDGSLYVSAPPSIWKLTDTMGTGAADQRVEWFAGKTLTGCANDLHGPYLGPDGWIYWCKGAFAKQKYERPGKKPFTTRASHIFRARPDGTGIEPVMTGGMDNPVDVAFTPGGERIFTTTFFQHPGGGQRDGLIHAIYGAVYGKDHDPVYEHPWTNPELMPVMTHMGPAAPCGLLRYESEAFGKEYKDNLFACQFNMHKVSRHILIPDGATFKTEDHDFLVSDNLDFHPTDVIEDADGSLLVVDTGGWYKLCCPTSQLHKPDIMGAIYRIRKTGAPKIEDPRGLKLAWNSMKGGQLAKLLDDPRPSVRRRAVETLAKKGDEAVLAILTLSGSAEARRNGVWVAARIDHPGSREFLKDVLTDRDESVQLAALHCVSLLRIPIQLPAGLLTTGSAHVRRAAAEALGRIGDKAAVPALLEALGMENDRGMEHALIYALIEIGARDRVVEALKSQNQRQRRAALIALDQMENGKLEAATVAAELAATDPPMKRTAAWIIGRHPEWGPTLTGYLRDRLATKERTPAETDELVQQLARFARTPAVQELLSDQLTSGSLNNRRAALQAIARAGLKQAPATWSNALAGALSKEKPELLEELLATTRALSFGKEGPKDLIEVLQRIGRNKESGPANRLAALAAIPNGPGAVDEPLFQFLSAQFRPESAAGTRGLAADVLTKAKLTNEQLIQLAGAFETIGPLEVDRLLEVFAQSKDEKVGMHLLDVLSKSPIRSGMRVDAIKQRIAKYPASVQKKAETLYAEIDTDHVKQVAHLEKLLESTKNGDTRRGQQVFHSTKAACFSCHQVGYRGGNIGPDLTRIGAIRSERDLLESIVFPSASFVRGYEPVVVATKDGKTHNGLIKKDGPDEILLTIAADKEERIARSEIEAIEPSKVSVMPAGLDQQLSVQDLADLVAFLKACK